MAKYIVQLSMKISAKDRPEAAKKFTQKIKDGLNGSQSDIEEFIGALRFSMAAEPSQPEGMERSK